MAQQYPYELLDTIISSLTIRRTPELVAKIEIPVTAEIKVAEPSFPTLQLNLRLKSPDDSKVFFDVEVIGLFKYLGNKPQYDQELNREFTFDKGVYILWPVARQMIRIVTSEMGMNPLNIRMPVSFEDAIKTQ